MMGRWYALEGKVVVEADSPWHFEFMTLDERRVARTELDGADVSTVFLGLDHGYGGGPPLVFETLVFGGPMDGECHRYSTWEQAEVGHKAMVQLVKIAMSQ
jgi:hypothetical protein